jgi:hypothetical protein
MEENKAERKAVIVRFPSETYIALKREVDKGSMNSWIVDAVQEKLEKSVKPKPEAKAAENLDKPSPFMSLRIIRQEFIDAYGQYAQDFYALEKLLLDSMPGGYIVENMKNGSFQALPAGLKNALWDRYFIKLHEFDWDDRKAFREFMALEEARKLCSGDNPNQIVYGEITALDLARKFKRDKLYNIRAIALELGLDYQATYHHIIPWLVEHGFKVKGRLQL